MERLRLSCALLGVAALSTLGTIVVVSLVSSPAQPATSAARKIEHRHVRHAAAAKLASLRVRTHLPKAAPKHATPRHVPKAAPKHATPGAARHRSKPAQHVRPLLGARRIGATPSLYERTTSIAILRAQGCLAGRARTNGLVVLDFGKLDYRRSRGGYGTITFADTFASNRAITWAMKSYARGYSECLPHGSSAHIELARGTSNYGQSSVPSTYTAGRLWAGATVALGNYLRRHDFDHVTAAAADDVEPAWDRGFRRTYDFFRGYAGADHGYLLYNYGSLDGGVGGIWKLRQVYYVAGGMHEARAVPEIYNRSMAQQWAELARLSYARYGKPIKLAGLMTQHWTSCSGCGYTAPKARHVLVHELAKVQHGLPVRETLSAITNIGSAPAVSP
jgi:hypothetical protein